jgi:hypothetical protein
MLSRRRDSFSVMGTSTGGSSEKEAATMERETQYFLTVKTHTNISQIQAEEWNSLLRFEDSPFLQHEWFDCLEASGCAVPATGWNPCHLTIRMVTGRGGEVAESDDPGELVAAAPVYIKTHSMGEFIFDNEWASAAYRSGLDYYPKVLVAVPFTPASGARLLLKRGLSRPMQREIRRMVGGFLQDLAKNNGFSSVHVNFCEEEEIGALQEAQPPYLHRTSMQFHWVNRNKDKDGLPYSSFDEYLSAFRSKRRIKIKKERRSIYEDAGLTLQVLRGRDIPDSYFDSDLIFKLYVSTIDKLFYGRQYLNEAFFRLLKGKFREPLCLVLARDAGGEVVAGTFNVISNDKRFYGRYWGCVAPEDIKNLHFETCYYKSIEYCIEAGLAAMEPGAGNSDFKFMRGFEPVHVHSMHHLVHPGLRQAVDDFLQYERREVSGTVEYLSEKSAVRGRRDGQGGEGGQAPGEGGE